MSTSPDDGVSVSPPRMTTFVLPTEIAPHVADFLASLGMAVAPHPGVPDGATYVVLPEQHVQQAVSDIGSLYAVQWVEDASGSRARVIERAAEHVEDSDLWFPVADPSGPVGMLPILNPHDVPLYRPTNTTCVRCAHPVEEHHQRGYARGVDPESRPDVTIAVCLAAECPCLSRVAHPGVVRIDPHRDTPALPHG